MIDKNKTYKTRDGRDVRIYATDGGDHPVHGAYKTDEFGWWAYKWNADGKAYPNEDHKYDLIEVKPRIKRTVWLNVYRDTQHVYPNKESAAFYDDIPERIACIPIEIDVEDKS